ncbi:MAG: hypothetical protein Q9216_004607 [Gyalolechia sp. 2 TL-2023]
MDTNTYLTSQGWRGHGYALHPSGHGIKEPLLVSRRTDRLGVGKKAYDAHADQWWSRAFDETLKSLNGEQSMKETTGKICATVIQTSICTTKWNRDGGLYGSFVRGQGLEGTINPRERAAMRKPHDGTSRKASCLGFENNAGKKSSEQDLKDKVADERSEKNSTKSATSLSQGCAPAKVNSRKRSDYNKTVPLREVAKCTKNLGSSDDIVADSPSALSNEHFGGDMAQLNCDAANSNAVAIHKTVADQDKALSSDNGAIHRVTKRGKSSKKYALKAITIDQNIDSHGRPEQQSIMKRRRRQQEGEDR